MSYIVYKLIHFGGIFIMIGALAIAAMHIIRGGTRATDPHRRALFAVHGFAAFMILLGGFGMLARLGVMHGALPTWVLIKLGIWTVLAASMALPYRGARAARVLLVAAPLLALAAAATALYKPS